MALFRPVVTSTYGYILAIKGFEGPPRQAHPDSTANSQWALIQRGEQGNFLRPNVLQFHVTRRFSPYDRTRSKRTVD